MTIRRPMATLITAAAGALAVALLLPLPGAAQSGRGTVDEGNRLYEEGRYQEALERYMKALGENPESPLIRFNAGNALYQSQDFQRALEAYQEAIESGDPALASAAWYNLGDALYQGQDLQASAEAFKQALRLNPNDVDAKHNLERVLQQMREQEQNQDGDQNQDEDQQDQDQQDQEQQQDQDQEGDSGEEQDEEGESQPEDQEQDPQQGQQPAPQEGAMSPEEAQRLLEALDEDPGDVNRRAASALGRRPRKKW